MLTVIIPMYNAENFIEHAIISVLQQDMNNIELLLVNDGSKDQTELICKKYESEKIRYFKTENLGAGHARNVGINEAKGDYIAFLDSDDLFLSGVMDKNFFNKLNMAKEKNIDIIRTNCLKTDMQLKELPQIYLAEKEVLYHMPKLEFWTCIYSTNFLKENHIQFYEYKLQDIESAFRYKVFLYASKIEIMNDFIYYLQRNNFASNVHTWNLYNLCEIKTTVYFDLYKNFAKASEDKTFLLETIIDSIFSYWKICIRFGCTNNKDQYAHMKYMTNDLLKDTKRIKNNVNKNLKLFFLTLLLHAKKITDFICKRKHRPNKPSSVNTNTVEVLSIDEMLVRLKEITAHACNNYL